MALWHRIRPTRIDCLSRQCKRWHSLFPGASAASTADRVDGRRSFTAREEPLVRPSPSFRFAPVRSFAAPVQAKPKPSADDNGPRLNEAITAAYVRLVTDEGHNIVSMREALYQAMKLNLDLVEVQRTADPPVCKIMDFHKEKFNKEVKEKERAKSKVTLRNGENKEVRFKAKTELKDLKIKAETIKRLMERGYRVKCTALPMGKEEDDLVGLLSRLLALIKDVTVVETGPHVVDTKQAYVIVRHNKFATKKSGKTVGEVVDAMSRAVQSAVPNTQGEEEWEPVECSSETEGEVLSDQVEVNAEDPSDAPTASLKEAPNGVSASKSGLGLPKAKLELKKEKADVKASPSFVASQSEPSVVERNRYSKRGETKPAINQGRMPQQATRNESGGRVQLDPKQRQFNRPHPSPPSPSNRIFSAPKTAGSGDQNKPGVTAGKPSEPSSPSKSFGIFSPPKTAVFADQKPSNPTSPTPSYGIFVTSENIPSGGQSNAGDASGVKPRNSTSSPTPSYGIFSATKSTVSDDKKNSGDATMGKPTNPSSPTPSYGIFSSPRTASSGDQRSPGDVTSNLLNLSRSGVENPRQDIDKSRHGRWGVFSGAEKPPP